MIITYNWLKEYVDIELPVAELSERLTMVGLEVAAQTPVGVEINNKDKVHLVKVEALKPHENSDKLKVCRVKVGKAFYQLVTNSPNVRENDYVVFCRSGTRLVNGIEIKETEIRGVKSEGMLLPKEFLNLEEKSADIWILGQDEKKALEEFKTYSQSDTVIEIELTANRSDCLSVIGVAREVAAMLNKEFKLPKPVVEETLIESPNVEILARKLCPRYTSRIIRGVKVQPSPATIRRKLELCGIRSINNIVDATNYVVLEFGHPTHAFDLNRLSDQKIVVRTGLENEKLQTLDDQEYTLTSKDIVIADGKKGVALGGIMGGLNSEIEADTTDLLLESAFFDPVAIRLTAKRLGIRSESSYRFERTADWGIPPVVLDRLTELILQTSMGKAGSAVDLYVNLIKDKIVNLRPDYVAEKLGFELSAQEIESFLKRLQFPIMARRKQSFEVKIPTFRSDVERPIDVIEEIARIYGYNQIPTHPYRPPVDIPSLMKQKRITVFSRTLLTGLGFTEVVNFAFTNEKNMEKYLVNQEKLIRLGNPLTADATVLRKYLFMGMLGNVEYNHKNAYMDDLRFFEIGHTFFDLGENFDEKTTLGLCITGKNENYYTLTAAVQSFLQSISNHSVSFKNLKIDFLHPLTAAEIMIEKESIGFVGEIHPDIQDEIESRYPVYVAELDLKILENLYIEPIQLKPVTKYPPVSRDLSVVVDQQLLVRDLMNDLSDLNPLIKRVEFTDLYQGVQIGENKKSVTFSILLESIEKTLTEREIQSVMQDVLSHLETRFKATLRS